jgi:lysozyme
MNDEAVKDTLKFDEGFRNKAYKDSLGIWTIGYGTNLQELEIDKDTANKWLDNKFERAKAECIKVFRFWDSLSAARQGVLVSMVYQMGLPRVMGFQNFLRALADGNYAKAEQEMLDSKWAKSDSPERARRHALRMRTGVW